MVALQILSKVLATKDLSIIEDNLLTEEYFVGYEDEFNYIVDHYHEYGDVPDKATFLSKFDVELVEVAESDRYLLNEIREEYLYYKCVPIVQHVANLLKTDSNAAAEYMAHAIKDLQPTYQLGGVNIIAQAIERYDKFEQRKQKHDDFFFTTGFEELDDLIHGLNRECEFLVIVARTNMGKSWMLAKICTHIWQIGFNVGYISPEMSPENLGYRFDTLYKNFSNKGLMWSNDTVKEEDYKKYIDELPQKENKFIVATPLDFDRKITVTKLKNWIKQNDLKAVAVDGITYMTDERYKRGDSRTITLTNISEDLRMLSLELGVPVMVVVQANRGGIKEEAEGTPDLENIRDSDGISYNATKVLSLRQLKDGILELGIKKNTFGLVGGKLKYSWNIDTGEFVNVPCFDDGVGEEKTKERVKQVKKQYKGDKEDVF